jgi:hypothetical protein
MSQIKRRWRWFLGFGLVLAVITLRGCVFRPATDFPGNHFNQGKNALWLGVEWVSEAHTPDEITALADDLQSRQIRYVFVYTSFLRPDGEFNRTFEYARSFLTGLRAANANVLVLAWIGLPLDASSVSDGYHVELSDQATRQQIVDLCLELVRENGFDGIHLDPEPVHSGDQDVLALLDELASELEPDTILSIAARHIWPLYPNAPWPFIDDVSWRGDYYRDVAKRVDQIAVMTYDSGLPWGWMYHKWAQFQTISISRALEGSQVELLMGIPTSEEVTRTHHPNAENMRTGLEGVIAGLNDKAARSDLVSGVAIYPAWETDEDEWLVYDALWLGAD